MRSTIDDSKKLTSSDTLLAASVIPKEVIEACKKGNSSIVGDWLNDQKQNNAVNQTYNDEYCEELGSRNVRWNGKTTLLMCACGNGQPKIASLLLEHGALLATRNEAEKTALYIAESMDKRALPISKDNVDKYKGFVACAKIIRDHVDILRRLRTIDKDRLSTEDKKFAENLTEQQKKEVRDFIPGEFWGKDESQDKEQMKEFCGKHKSQDKEQMKELFLLREINNYQSIEKATNAGDFTILIYFCGAGNAKMVKLLLEHGAEVEYQDCEGNNALICAARRGNHECVQIIIDHLSSQEIKEIINIKNGRGNTALKSSCWAGCLRCVRILLENGASTELENKEFSTAMTSAIDRKHTRIILLLHAYSGCVLLRKGWGSPSFFEESMDKCTKLLQQKIANCNKNKDAKTTQAMSVLSWYLTSQAFLINARLSVENGGSDLTRTENALLTEFPNLSDIGIWTSALALAMLFVLVIPLIYYKHEKELILAVKRRNKINYFKIFSLRFLLPSSFVIELVHLLFWMFFLYTPCIFAWFWYDTIE